MATQPSPALKGSVSFQDVIDQDPTAWAQETPEVKSQVADAFFQKYFGDLPDFQAEPPEIQSQIRTEFNKKYGVGQEQADILEIGNLATLGLPARAWDAATGGVGHAAEIRDAQMNRFATDPGLYGDMYRLSQNPVTQTIGSIGGAFAGAGRMAGSIAPGVLGKIPFLNRLAPATQQAVATTGAFSGMQNLGGVMTGQQTPQEAVMNTLLQTATGGLMGKSRIKNAAIQGAGGYAADAGSSVGSDVLAGRPTDWQRANQAGMRGGAMGAGMGLAFGGGHPQEAPKQSRYRQTLPEAHDTGSRRFTVGKPDDIQATKLDKTLKGQVQQIQQRQSLDERKTFQARLSSLDNLYQQLSEVINHADTPEPVRKVARERQSQIKADYDRLKGEREQKFGRKPKTERTHITDKRQLSDLVAFVKEMRALGHTKEADVAMGKFSPETRAKVYDEVKRQQTAEKQKANEAKTSNKALEKAEGQNRQRELDQLKGGIKESFKLKDQQAVQAKTSNKALEKAEGQEQHRENRQLKGAIQERHQVQKEQAAAEKTKAAASKKKASKTKASDPKQNIQGMMKLTIQHNKSRTPVFMEYEAEAHGETSTYRDKVVIPVTEPRVHPTTGKLHFRGINEDGQVHNYLFRDPDTGSRIVSMVPHDEPPRFKLRNDGEVVDLETGEIIPQQSKKATRSSILRSKVNDLKTLTERLERREPVSVEDILDMANRAKDAEVEPVYGKMDPPQKREKWDETTGEPC